MPFPTLVMAFARLKPGVTPEQAELMLAPQVPEMQKFWPPSRRVAWNVQPVRDRRIGDAARVGWLLMAAVAVFLLIACVNVANLMLARVAERQREFAVRAAVGAGKIRLARLALAESLLLVANGRRCRAPCGVHAPADVRRDGAGRHLRHRGRVD